MPENSSEVDVEGIDLRGGSKSTLSSMGDCGDDGSRNEYMDRANDPDITGEETQVAAGSLSAITEAKVDVVDSHLSEKTFMDPDVDPALLVKIVVGKIVGKREAGDFRGASQNVGTMAKLAQNSSQSKLTDIGRTEKNASREVDVTFSGLDQLTCWEDSVVVGVTGDYRVEDVSLVSGVVSHPAGLLADSGSVSLHASDATATEGKALSPAADWEQASPCASSLVSVTLLRERDIPLPCIRGLTTAEIWETESEDVGLHCASNKTDADQASMTTGKAEIKKSDCLGAGDVAATSESDQETDSGVRISSGMLCDEAPQQGLSSAEASTSCSLIEKKAILITRLGSEEKDHEVHASLVHETRTITSIDVIAPTEDSAGARQAASIPSASVRATEAALVAGMEKEFVDEEQLGEAGDSPLPVDEDGKGGGKVDQLSGSTVEVISVGCVMEVNIAGQLVAREAGTESMSRPAEAEVTGSPIEELTGSNIAGSEADTRVDTSASECTVEDEKLLMEIAEPKASVRDEEAKDLVMEEPVMEDAPSREEEREEDVLKEESCRVEDAVEGTSQMSEGPSSSVQEKEPEVANGSVDFGVTLVGTVESVMKERELDIVKNLVRNLSRGVSTNQEELSSEPNTATSESPNLVRANDSNSTSSSCGSAAQKLEVPVVEGGCIGSEQESKKLRNLILHGLKLLKSVATDIELKQKTTVTSVKGGIELDTSDELKGNGEDESLAETMKTQICTEREVGAHFLHEVPKADDSVATTEVEVRAPVAGLRVSHNDEARSLRRDTSNGVKPSQEAGWSEEVKVLENPIFSPQSPDKMQLLEGFRTGSLINFATDQPEVARTVAMDLGHAVCSSVVPVVFEGAAESSECKDSSDASQALANEKVETLVTLEPTGLISELHVPVTDEDVKVSGRNVEHCSRGSQHAVVGGPKVTREAVKAAPGEHLDYPSLDPQKETCSLDTRASVIRLEPSGKETGAASRQGGQTVFDRSHTFIKSKVEEISHEGDRVPFGLQPNITVEKVLAISTHDSLPVAKRSLPVVANKEAATKFVMETTLFTSYTSEERKGPARIKRASKGDYQEGGRASENELAQEKQKAVGLSARGVLSPASSNEAREDLAGGGFENWERPGGMRATDAPITSDVTQITQVDVSSQDGKDSVMAHELSLAFLVEAAKDPQQLMSNEEGSVKKNIRAAVEAVGSDPTVIVKRKLQTKRKKFVGETEKKPTKAACVDPVPPRVEALTIQDANAVVHEDVGMHGSEELVRVMDGTGVSPTQPEVSGADQAVVLWSPEGNSVEGNPTECINGDQTQALALRCGCGKPAVLKTVGYKSQNRGLRYYSCEKFKPTFFTRKRNRKRDNDNLRSCRFFQWLDSPRVTMEDKKELRLQKRRQLEQILAARAVTTNYSTRSSSKQELSQYDVQRNQRLLQGVPAVYGLSVEELKHENSDEREPSSKKQKLNKMDPSLSTADSVAFSTRASAARKRKGPCVAVPNDRSTPGSGSCGDESSHEVSVGDWNNTIPREKPKRVKSEADKDDTTVHTYSRRGESSRPPRRSGYMLRAKNIGKMERATADTHHVRKLLPVALAYEKSREVVLEESSEEEVSGDQKEESNEENSLQLRSSQEEGVETPSSTPAERTPVKSRSQRACSTGGSGQNGRHTQSRGKLEASKCSLQEVRRDPSGSESSLSGGLHKSTNQFPQWIDVPLTCPFENKEYGKSGASGQQAVQHEVGRYSPFVGSHNLVVNFPTASQSGERRTISTNTVLLVKEKAREVSLAVNFKRGRSPATEPESHRVAWSKPADRMKKRSERVDVSDYDDEETGPSGSRGLRSLKDMLKTENSDGTLADYEVADESQPPYCECKTVKRRAALKTVLSNSANHGLRYWVCVNHRPLFQKKSLWEGDPNDESCKFFRWLDTPIISYAERKKKVAARRRRNERRRR